jgi:hypothetical protein
MMELTLEQELAQVRNRARKRAAEAQAEGLKPWAAAALDEALRTEVLAIHPLRNIPMRRT